MILPHVHLSLDDVLRYRDRWSDRVVNIRDIVDGPSLIHPKVSGESAEDRLKRRAVIYVGRRNSIYQLSGHALANPYKLTDYKRADDPRLACLHSYWDWLDRLEPHYLVRCLLQLRGHRLACWCSPELCHAHVLAVLANQEDVL